jgi:hypothetical protein
MFLNFPVLFTLRSYIYNSNDSNVIYTKRFSSFSTDGIRKYKLIFAYYCSFLSLTSDTKNGQLQKEYIRITIVNFIFL